MKNVDFLKLHGVNVENSLELFGDMQTYNETLGDFLNDIDQKLEQLKETKEIDLQGDLPSPKNPPSACKFHTRCPFATDICSQKEPETIKISDSHYVKCHLYF